MQITFPCVFSRGISDGLQMAGQCEGEQEKLCRHQSPKHCQQGPLTSPRSQILRKGHGLEGLFSLWKKITFSFFFFFSATTLEKLEVLGEYPKRVYYLDFYVAS